MQDSYGISIGQRKYRADLLKLGIHNSEPAKTLLNASDKLSLDDKVERIDEKYYKSMVEELMYVTHTRQDIMLAVSLVSTL